MPEVRLSFVPTRNTTELRVVPRHSAGSEQREEEWLRENWPGEDVGYNRKYETMVFRMKGRCDSPKCGCGAPLIEPSEIDSDVYNLPGPAREGHMKMCHTWAEKAMRS